MDKKQCPAEDFQLIQKKTQKNGRDNDSPLRVQCVSIS